MPDPSWRLALLLVALLLLLLAITIGLVIW